MNDNKPTRAQENALKAIRKFGDITPREVHATVLRGLLAKGLVRVNEGGRLDVVADQPTVMRGAGGPLGEIP